MNLRDKKGSIAIFVLIALLFMASFLIIMFAGNTNKSKVVKEQIDIIKSIYGRNLEDVEDIYGKAESVPEITLEISQKTGGVMNIIITSNGMTDELEVEEYKFNEETKYSKEELYKYIEDNNLYDVEKELEIIIVNDIKNKTAFKETVKFVKPTINELPSQIIVGNTEILDTYVEYDEIGGTTEYIAFDKSFSTINELINFVIDNNKYEEVEIKINAKGNNNLNATSTQNITFEQASEPIIKTLPNPIWVNVTSIDDSYVVYNGTEAEEETYKIVEVPEETFNTMTAIVEYAYNWLVTNNQNEVTVNIKINAKGKNNLSSESTQTITFKKPLEPVIGVIPSQIITNITSVSESYVTYDDKGKKEETYKILEVPDEIFNTMTEVVAYADKWLFDNKQYEVDVNIKVTAKGNTNLTAESTQTIKFIRGVKVTNETEFTTALASTSPSYIQLANDIASSNTISVDGVTHKLDLNNHTVSKTVTNESFTFITLGSNTNLTVIDSSSEKNGTILAKLSEPNYDTGSSDARLNTIYTINNQGTLNIESGTVASDLEQKVGAPNKNIHVKDLAKTIKNTGTVNLNGGAITSNAITQGASDSATRNGEATAIGIENTGTVNLNSGNITCYAEANMRMTSIIYGETRAYAYGVTNSGGTVNRNDGVNISVTAVANDEGSYKETEDSAEIKEV